MLRNYSCLKPSISPHNLFDLMRMLTTRHGSGLSYNREQVSGGSFGSNSLS